MRVRHVPICSWILLAACVPNRIYRARVDGGQDASIVADAGSETDGGANDGAVADGRAAGPTWWIIADQGITTVYGQISRWADRSGDANDAFMTDPNRQPLLVANAVNGRPAVRFGGASSLDIRRTVNLNTFAIFIVGRNDSSDGSISMILGPAGREPNDQIRWETATSILVVGIGNEFAPTIAEVGNTRVYHLLTLRFDGSRLDTYRDGVLVGTTPATTNGLPFSFLSLGSYYSVLFMVGELAEVLIYDRPLSDSAFASTNDYLRSKYALP